MAEKRMSLSLPKEMLDKLTELKKADFYDSTWSELIRFVLDKGIVAIGKERG